MPIDLESLKKKGHLDLAEALVANVSARVAWSKTFEAAIEKNDAEFFDTFAAVIRHRADREEKAHPAEFHTWNEFQRFLRTNEYLSEDGKSIYSDYPTKRQIREAVEALKVVNVTSWPRVWKRLNLDWLPRDRSGPRKRKVR